MMDRISSFSFLINWSITVLCYPLLVTSRKYTITVHVRKHNKVGYFMMTQLLPHHQPQICRMTMHCLFHMKLEFLLYMNDVKVVGSLERRW